MFAPHTHTIPAHVHPTHIARIIQTCTHTNENTNNLFHNWILEPLFLEWIPRTFSWRIGLLNTRFLYLLSSPAMSCMKHYLYSTHKPPYSQPLTTKSSSDRKLVLFLHLWVLMDKAHIQPPAKPPFSFILRPSSPDQHLSNQHFWSPPICFW